MITDGKGDWDVKQALFIQFGPNIYILGSQSMVPGPLLASASSENYSQRYEFQDLT